METRVVNLSNEKSLTVRELKVSDVTELYETEEGTRILVGVAAGLPGDVQRLLKKCVIDLSPEDFDAAVEGVSDYLKVEETFRELNEMFLTSLPERLKKMNATADKFRGMMK